VPDGDVQFGLLEVAAQFGVLTRQPAYRFVCFPALTAGDRELGQDALGQRTDIQMKRGLRFDGALDPQEDFANFPQ
jgi:hypothetical protein